MRGGVGEWEKGTQVVCSPVLTIPLGQHSGEWSGQSHHYGHSAWRVQVMLRVCVCVACCGSQRPPITPSFFVLRGSVQT